MSIPNGLRINVPDIADFFVLGVAEWADNFNPRAVSLDIRTPKELAAVNEFLIALGRDVSLKQPGLAGMPEIGRYTAMP